jgi:hypothetical protein
MNDKTPDKTPAQQRLERRLHKVADRVATAVEDERQAEIEFIVGEYDETDEAKRRLFTLLRDTAYRAADQVLRRFEDEPESLEYEATNHRNALIDLFSEDRLLAPTRDIERVFAEMGVHALIRPSDDILYGYNLSVHITVAHVRDVAPILRCMVSEGWRHGPLRKLPSSGTVSYRLFHDKWFDRDGVRTPRAYLYVGFTGSACRFVQTGTKMVEQPVMELRCDEPGGGGVWA